MARYMGDATSFWSAVDSPIRSETASNFGASPPHSFASVVDYALRSSCASEADFRTSRVSSFASGVDYVIRSSSSSTGGTDLETFPVPGFTSEVHSTTVAEGSSPVLSNVTEHAVKGLQLFSQAELVAATNNFSLNNKIGAGRLGVVYIGKLVDGREVAIKRVETLYDHLHENGSNVLNRWKMRITIALDASRGIEYLHNYAVPLFIHGDVKSSNILLDATWMARVSDFKFSLMSPEAECDYRRIKLGGTVGYIDPEYYDLNMLTAKSDVYGLGVVLLELLTGKRAIFLDGEDGGTLSVHRLVDFAVPAILAGELVNILDPRVGPPDVNEIEALELVAKTALHCVNRKGKDRPSMADIVICLERALAIWLGLQSFNIKPLLLRSPERHHPLAIASLSLAIALAVDHRLVAVTGRVAFASLSVQSSQMEPSALVAPPTPFCWIA